MKNHVPSQGPDTHSRLIGALIGALGLSCTACGSVQMSARGAPDALRPRGTELERKDFEAKKAACEGRDWTACTALGRMYTAGKATAADPVRAVELFGVACAEKHWPACIDLARSHELGRGATPDIDRAMGIYQSVCDSGYLTGCAYLADHHMEQGIRYDPKRAAALHDKACSANIVTACTQLGRLYDMGAGVTKDVPRALLLFKKACDGGDMKGCYLFAMRTSESSGGRPLIQDTLDLLDRACKGGVLSSCQYLAMLYFRGEKVTKSLGKATPLFTKACDAGMPSSCSVLGLLFENSKVQGKSMTDAIPLYQTACDKGDGHGCELLAFIYSGASSRSSAPADRERAIVLADRGCELKDGTACKRSGILREQPASDENAARAVTWYEKACDLGEFFGCFKVGRWYEHLEVEARAVDYYRRAARRGGAELQEYLSIRFNGVNDACERNYGGDCMTVGRTYAYGRGVPRDASRAASFYRKACDNKSTIGCVALGRAYAKGDGVPRDPKRAAELFWQVCQQKGYRGCLDYLPFANADRARTALEIAREWCGQGSGPACEGIGLAYAAGKGRVPRDDQAAQNYFLRACFINLVNARCGELARLYAAGRGDAKRDDGLATRLFARACEQGEAAFCPEAARRASLGLGVPKDAKKAKELWTLGCDGGDAASCARAGVQRVSLEPLPTAKSSPDGAGKKP